MTWKCCAVRSVRFSVNRHQGPSHAAKCMFISIQKSERNICFSRSKLRTSHCYQIMFCEIIKNLSFFKLCVFYCRPFVTIPRPIGYASLSWSIVNCVAWHPQVANQEVWVKDIATAKLLEDQDVLHGWGEIHCSCTGNVNACIIITTCVKIHKNVWCGSNRKCFFYYFST
jgi:hypothetical protein